MASILQGISVDWAAVYIDGEKIENVPGTLQLPAMQFKEIIKQLPGGEVAYYSKRFERFEGAIRAELPYEDLYLYALNPNAIRTIKFSIAYQEENLESGTVDSKELKIEMNAHIGGIADPAEVSPGEMIETNIKFDAISLRITIGGIDIVEIDKRTAKNIVKNTDLAKAFRLAFGSF